LPVKSNTRDTLSWLTAAKKGTPDWMPGVLSTKPVVAIKDTMWEVLWTPNVPAGDTVAVDIYTVPVGYQLNIGGAVVTCEASCIQMVRMAHTPGVIGDYRFDMKGDLIFGPMNATLLAAGDTLTVMVYNNDVADRDFSISIVGVLERIS